VHHNFAHDFFRQRPDESYLAHSLTFTEILVGPMRVGHEAFVLRQLEGLGIAEWTPTVGSAGRLARLRVDTGLKLPDCCVLDAAITTDAPLATFDTRLARAAASIGVASVLSAGSP
jgi:rRNA-processing protein FCF1